MNKLAVAIFSFKRHNYLKRCLASLERDNDVDLADFFLFQDGAVNRHSGTRYATDESIDWSVKVFEDSGLPNKEIVRSERNIGIAAAQVGALFELFDRGYEYTTSLGDDFEVGRHFVKTLNVVYEQFKNDKRAGVLRVGPLEPPMQEGRVHSFAEAKALENKVVYGFYDKHDLGIWRDCWETIKAEIYDYYETVQQFDYIQMIMRKYGGSGGRFQELSYLDKQIAELEAQYGTISEDVVPEILAGRKGYQGLQTLTPRTKSFGRISSFPCWCGTGEWYISKWMKFGLDRITLWDIGNVDEYEVIENWPHRLRALGQTPIEESS